MLCNFDHETKDRPRDRRIIINSTDIFKSRFRFSRFLTLLHNLYLCVCNRSVVVNDLMVIFSVCILYQSKLFRALFTVAAQDVIRIGLPGQDVELMCDVIAIGSGSTAWRINGSLPAYSLSNLRDGAAPGHNVRGMNSIIIEDIMMNDVRNGSQYQCEINSDDIPNSVLGNLTILYVAGEFKDLKCVCCCFSVELTHILVVATTLVVCATRIKAPQILNQARA